MNMVFRFWVERDSVKFNCLENLESRGILEFHFPGLQSHGF